ncbi:hypothetical protein [Serratia fonticola]|uniref:hypothetical protein n=1 Tax=Serratia fonticola TaxID=47917 RepID=UPI003AAA4366
MKVSRIFLCLCTLLSLPVFAAPVHFSCEKNNFILYENASGTKHAVIINGDLTENVNIDEFSYGDLGDSLVISFDVWGANGGMHNHYTTIFPNNGMGVKQIVQLLDADNRPRGDAITKKCSLIKQP